MITKSKTKEIKLGYIQICNFNPKNKQLFPEWYYDKNDPDYEENQVDVNGLGLSDIILKPNKVYTLIIDYPVTNKYSASFTTPKTGLTRIQLVNLICRHYRKMYKEEEKDVNGPTGNIPGMFNRATSNGRYGIWGHDIGDLTLHSAYIKGNIITLGVDS
jgi:hypothetical protein